MIRQGFAIIARTGPACETQRPGARGKELMFRPVSKRESFPKSGLLLFGAMTPQRPAF
jgi:hypothetical protein